jgi:hypothetical protein
VKQDFAAIILGGTGQVGGAAVAELLATSECREVVIITRKAIAPRSRVRNVVLDTGATDFAERTAALARYDPNIPRQIALAAKWHCSLAPV